MRRQQGYSLIEVIVAFALLALALTLLLGTLSGGTRQLRRADDITRATLHAQSLMAVQGVDEPLRPQRRQGSFEQGRFRWVLDVRPYVEPRPRVGADIETISPLRLMELDLRVTWGETPAQRLHWRSLRLVPVDAQGATR